MNCRDFCKLVADVSLRSGFFQWCHYYARNIWRNCGKFKRIWRRSVTSPKCQKHLRNLSDLIKKGIASRDWDRFLQAPSGSNAHEWQVRSDGCGRRQRGTWGKSQHSFVSFGERWGIGWPNGSRARIPTKWSTFCKSPLCVRAWEAIWKYGPALQNLNHDYQLALEI